MGNDKKENIHSMQRSSSRRKLSAQDFYTPFSGLDQHLLRISPPTSHCPGTLGANTLKRPCHAAAEGPEDEEKLFLEAMADVAPLARTKAERVPPSPPTKVPPRFFAREEAEVHACLTDLVIGEGPFELSYSDEYVDGCLAGLSPRIMKKLRNGDFSYQAYVDLHGCYREQARERVIHFVRESFARKRRCILIVSGRGLNSRDKEPVLKQGLVSWLTRAPLKRLVLAFSCARAYDGGAGAFYVLLRRNEEKGRIITPAVW